MLFGLLNLSFWGYFFATMILTQITIFSVTIFLHRAQAHRALDLHPIVSHFFRFWLWLTTGMVTREWVAIHRKHHAFTETEQDPHSPQIYGIKKVLFEGVELYRASCKDSSIMEKYGFGTPDDFLERKLYSKYSSFGIALMLMINLVLFGIPGISIWAIQMLWIPLFAAGVINGIGHYWGYRNFECPDASRNIVPWGIFVGGEELHNNHHTYASSAKLSNKWWELDIGYAMIRLLAFFRLAKVKKLPPEFELRSDKACVDMDTLRALVANRFQIMSQYTKEVIAPVVQEEKSRMSAASERVLHRAKKLLSLERSVMTSKAKERLNILLAERERLRTVYEYRMQLQDLWNRTASSQKELLDNLEQWCKQAQATGIEALAHFAQKIQGLTVKAA